MRNRLRQTVLWLHILTSVGWMSQALALLVLLSTAHATADQATRVAATAMAHTLDTTLLAPMANASAVTGFVLAAATPWGWSRHWWVLTKLTITLAQLYAGIFILSGVLHTSAEAARTGAPMPVDAPQLVGVALMASAIAFQGWLSVAKPWGRTRWSAGKPKPPTGPAWLFALGVAAPVFDTVLGLFVGFPSPALSVVLIVVLVVRAVRGRRLDRAFIPSAGRRGRG